MLIEEGEKRLTVADSGAHEEQCFLAVDGGATNCAVTVASSEGYKATGYAGGCNVLSEGVEGCMREIELACARAISNFVEEKGGESLGKTKGVVAYESPFTAPKKSAQSVLQFKKVWVGVSGICQLHQEKREKLLNRLEMLFNVTAANGDLFLTHDDVLLTSALHTDDTIRGGLAVIAGTGAVCTAFQKHSNGEITRVGRSGGWGPLVGDHGSAFAIGKKALQLVLSDIEARQGEDPDLARTRMGPLEKMVLSCLKCTGNQLLHTVLEGDSWKPQARIARLARCVTKLAFDVLTDETDFRAMDILKSAARDLVKYIKPLTGKELCHPPDSMLILGGSLMKCAGYRKMVMEELESQDIYEFKKVVLVNHTSATAAEMLANRYADGASQAIEAMDEDDNEDNEEDGGLSLDGHTDDDGSVALSEENSLGTAFFQKPFDETEDGYESEE
ncbi:hypothetical protein KEM55_008381 [Ascosphaera atra]|nr:hypothetical protein KEM55_008381 [Ascosphaera atra]